MSARERIAMALAAWVAACASEVQETPAGSGAYATTSTSSAGTGAAGSGGSGRGGGGGAATGGGGGAGSTGGTAGASQGGLGGGGAPPCTLPPGGLVAHWIADSIVGASGDAVTTWPDSAGGFDLASSGNAPTLEPGVLEGHAVVRFDGVDDTLSTSVPVLRFGMGLDATAFVVADSDVSTGARTMWQYGEASGNGAGLSLSFCDCGLGQGATFQTYTGAPAFAFSYAHEAGAHTVAPAVWTARKNAGDLDLFKNGVLLDTAPGTPAIDVTIDQLNVGLTGNGFNAWDGDIAEIAIYAGALDDAAMDEIVACLGERYDVAVAP